MEFPLIAKATP
ncbi:hypothetical protein D039_5010A, partial [Vibrio parahaemolyticus EKP-028]